MNNKFLSRLRLKKTKLNKMISINCCWAADISIYLYYYYYRWGSYIKNL